MKTVVLYFVAAILAAASSTSVTVQEDFWLGLFDDISPIQPAPQVSTELEIQCVKYLSCKTGPDPNGLNRQGHLNCLAKLGPAEVASDMQHFKQFFINPTFNKYEDIIAYGCQDQVIGVKALPLFILRKRSSNVGRTPIEQMKTEAYYNCLQELVQKCATEVKKGTLVV